MQQIRIFSSTGTRFRILVLLAVSATFIISTTINLRQSYAASYLTCKYGSSSQRGANCNKVGKQCNASCGIPIYHDDKPNGIEPANCKTVTTYVGYGIDNAGGSCGDKSDTQTCPCVLPYGVTIDYCANNIGLIATATGDLLIYTNSNDIRITANGKYHVTNGLHTEAINTGLHVETGDLIQSNMLSGAALGWRSMEETGYVFNTQDSDIRDDAAAKGYTIISEQIWADGITSHVFDTMDFNDAYVVYAVKSGLTPTPVPACSTNPVTLNVATTDQAGIILGGNATFSVAIPNVSQYIFVSDSFTPAGTSIVNPLDHNSNCNPGKGGEGDTDCYIKNRGSVNAYPDTNATWQLNYQNCSGAVCSPTCTATFPFIIQPYPSFMLTQRGTAYVGGKMTQPKLYPGSYFSTGLFSSYLPKSDHNPENQLSSNFIAAPYPDRNNHSGDFLPWYTGGLLNDPKYTPVTINVPSTTALTNSYLSTIFSTGLHIIHVTGGDAVFSGSTIDCKGSNIFVIDGSATFLTPIQNDSSTNSACLFFIGQTLVFGQSGDANYDGFFIAGGVNTNNYPGKLILTGGIMLQGDTQTTMFGRNINNSFVVDTDLKKNQPSEQLIYEGARYIDHFGSILSEPVQLNIRELQYTSAQ